MAGSCGNTAKELASFQLVTAKVCLEISNMRCQATGASLAHTQTDSAPQASFITERYFDAQISLGFGRSEASELHRAKKCDRFWDPRFSSTRKSDMTWIRVSWQTESSPVLHFFSPPDTTRFDSPVALAVGYFVYQNLFLWGRTSLDQRETARERRH